MAKSDADTETNTANPYVVKIVASESPTESEVELVIARQSSPLIAQAQGNEMAEIINPSVTTMLSSCPRL